MNDAVMETTPPDAASRGNGLREARERAGLHMVALAAMLKVPVQRLEALEDGRYEQLPDLTFARALASSVCRVLKIDPAPVLAALPASGVVRLGEAEGALNTPMPSRQSLVLAGSAAPREWRMPWAAAVALLVLVAAATLWFLLPERVVAPAATPTVEPVTAPMGTDAAPATATVGAAVTAPAAAVASVSTTETATALGSGAIETTPLAAQAPAQPAASVTEVPVPVATAATPAPASADTQPATLAQGLLQIRVTSPTWAQVTGASGRVLLQRSLQAGEQVAFGADLPLAVVVGRADAALVTVRGAAFDLAPISRNNVARFEVK